MKSILTLFLLAASWNFAVGAETNEERSAPPNSAAATASPSLLHLIPVWGLTGTAIKWDGGGTDRLTGFSLGTFADIGSGALVFESGLVLNKFGGQQSFEGTNVKIQLDYLAVPLFAKYNVIGDPENRLYFKGGVMPSELMSTTVALDDQVVDRATVNIRSFDLPAVIGLGASLFSSGRNSLVIEATYLRSLININSMGGAPSLRNEGFAFNAGVSVAL